MVLRQSVAPCLLVGTVTEMGIGLLRHGGEEARVPQSHVGHVSCLVEPLGCKLADRLQHPVARCTLCFAPSDEALVDERLQRVDVGGGTDGLRSLVRAPSLENRK